MKQNLKYLTNTLFGIIFFGGIIYLAFIANRGVKDYSAIKSEMKSGDTIIYIHKDNSSDTIIKK